MTYQSNYTFMEKLSEEFLADGMNSLPELLRIIINTALQAELAQHLQAEAYERSEHRQMHANG